MTRSTFYFLPCHPLLSFSTPKRKAQIKGEISEMYSKVVSRITCPTASYRNIELNVHIETLN